MLVQLLASLTRLPQFKVYASRFCVIGCDKLEHLAHAKKKEFVVWVYKNADAEKLTVL